MALTVAGMGASSASFSSLEGEAGRGEDREWGLSCEGSREEARDEWRGGGELDEEKTVSGVSPARALAKKLEMSGEVEGRLSLSPHNVVFLVKGNLSLERRIPWRNV